MVLLVLVGAYLLLVGAAYAFQRSLIYFPTRLREDFPFADSDVELVRFRAEDGPLLSARWTPPPDATAPVALVLHGNAGNLVPWSEVHRRWIRRGAGALLLDYRGYGMSEGSPSEEGLLADGRAALAFLAARGVPASRVVLHGISLGTAVAVPLAATHEVRGLVLESPFTSLADVAASAYPFLPVRWLLRDRYDTLAAAAKVRCPVLIFAGDCDRIVPLSQPKRLFDAMGAKATLRTLPGCDHDGVAFQPGYEEALVAFLRTLP